jgi:hypothetical protein
LKKILLVILILFLQSSFANAKLYFDAIGSYTSTDDARDQFGGGGALGIDITRDVNFFLKGIFTTRTLHVDSNNEENYTYLMGLFSIQYSYQIMRLPVFWISSVGVGYSFVEAEYKRTDSDISDSGTALALWTGVLFHWTQRVSPYFEVGYQQSFYQGDYSDKDIAGMQVLLGIRFTFYGVNRSIFDDY